MSNYTNVTYTDDEKTTWLAWFKMFAKIPENSRVLDIGCSSGNLGRELIKQKKCKVVGVDLDAEDVNRAKKHLDDAYVMNIESDNFSKLGKFDRIIFADVLEHLLDPVTSLEKCKKLLKKDGQILFSIPNMTHMGTRLMLLTGKFGYGETGILDKTHLHFYDEAEIRRIFNDSGYNLDYFDWTEYYIPQKVVVERLSDVGLKPSKKFFDGSKKIDAIALQYVGAASPGAKKKSIKLPAMSPWVDKTDEYVATLEKQANKRVEELEAELHAMRTSNSWKITKPLRGVKRLKGGK